jgi:predicted ArsR family transcriptional regulator
MSLDHDLERIAPLADPVRRRIYGFIAAGGGSVSRDEAAEAAGIGRPLAAFHLERLLGAGLLVEDRDPGPQVRPRRRGRPEKRYRLAPGELSVAVPSRSYELAATLFADALASVDRPPALDDGARARGRALGAETRTAVAPPRGQAALLEAAEAALDREGFAPHREGARICLANCPFDAVARRHRDVVCPMNLAMLEGFLSAAGIRDVEARLDPAPGRCCVVLEPVEAVEPFRATEASSRP